MMCAQQKLQRTQCHCSQVSPFNRKFLPFSSTTLPHMSLPAVTEWGYVELIATLTIMCYIECYLMRSSPSQGAFISLSMILVQQSDASPLFTSTCQLFKNHYRQTQRCHVEIRCGTSAISTPLPPSPSILNDAQPKPLHTPLDSSMLMPMLTMRYDDGQCICADDNDNEGRQRRTTMTDDDNGRRQRTTMDDDNDGRLQRR